MSEQKPTALVTGASSGIGRETAVKLAEKGFAVIAAARRMERLAELADQVEGITPVQVDLSEPDDTENFCGYLAELPAPVSVLVNNAGYSVRGVLEDVSIAAAKRLFEVNIFALMRITQACLPAMRRQRKGMVVNLSSIVGKFAFPGSGIYAASKHALEAITDAMRLELAPLGIRVVTIRPGPIATEFNDAATQMTGDLMTRTDPDYKPIYQTAGAHTGKLFADLHIPGPELIANLIMEAVLSETPKLVYSAGPINDEFLGNRAELDDEGFHRFMLEKFGLKDLRVLKT
ncbi:MAG: SDR family oxidoreductase [Desulfobacteraceae bacterium]|nr:SDR family oxidoreductase [Desulfobacteraceae bacterium]